MFHNELREQTNYLISLNFLSALVKQKSKKSFFSSDFLCISISELRTLKIKKRRKKEDKNILKLLDTNHSANQK